MNPLRRSSHFLAVLSLALALCAPVVVRAADPMQLKSAAIGGGITLHYIEKGHGPTVLFVHGSLSDYSYWQDQVRSFALRYRAVAYSRRYNYPNDNPDQVGYSAITDAEDLSKLIDALHLGRVYIVGHSYGALTALFLAKSHPEKIRAMVLAEPPAVSLLQHLSFPDTRAGEDAFADIQSRMIAPMRSAFGRGDTNGGVAAFIDYVFAKPGAWDAMSPEARLETLKDAHEWQVMMTSGVLFPEIKVEDVREIKVPTLLISGGQSYAFLGLIDRELERKLPHAQRIVFADAGHQMWLAHPEECRADAEAFFTMSSSQSEPRSGLKLRRGSRIASVVSGVAQIAAR
jgi:pimeloyl-ACP methyl ester carboxylesterase